MLPTVESSGQATIYMKKIFCVILWFFTLTVSASEWQYETYIDKMYGKPEYDAIVASSNSLDLSFPYDGLNRGFVHVKWKVDNGLNVGIGIERGQLTCGMDLCTVLIKFDEKAPEKFVASSSSSGVSNVVYLRDRNRFINGAKKARYILVKVNVYRHGNQLLEFDGAPLKWQH